MHKSISAEYLAGIQARSELLYTEQEVGAAYDRMAVEITACLKDKDPIVTCVMNGGVIPTGQLMPRLDFPMRQDYLHATRYRGETSGGHLDWLRQPQENIQGQTILVIDDILDEGYTLDAIVKSCIEAGAANVYSAVLIEKLHDRSNGYKADFVGLQLEDKYLYGCGMDYKGYLRNAAGIYAVSDSDL